MTYSEFGICVVHDSLEGEGVEAARLVEELGFGALWIAGSPRLPDLRPLLAATETLQVNTAVVNIWQYPAADLVADWHGLEADFPGRTTVGIGAGHRQLDDAYRTPLAATREYLDELDAAGAPPRERRVLAALGPKMLDLAAERCAGTIPYFVPIEHTRLVREQLGADPLLAAVVATVVDEDVERSRATARELGDFYLSLTNYANAIVRCGYPREEVAAGSDRVLDAVVARGSAEHVAAVARAQLDAGADHVALQTAGSTGVPRAEWTAIAAALLA